MSEKYNIIDEKKRVRELIAKLDGALVTNDYELAWSLFNLAAKHMGRMMPLTGVK